MAVGWRSCRLEVPGANSISPFASVVTFLRQHNFSYCLMYKLCMSGNCGIERKSKTKFSKDFKPPLHSNNDVTLSIPEYSDPFIHMEKCFAVFCDLSEKS